MRIVTQFAIAVVTAGLIFAPAAEAADCKSLQKIVSLPMTQLPDGRVTIPATLMNRPSVLLFDTGTGFRSISLQAARDLKLHIGTGNVVMVDLQGHRTQASAKVPEVTLGDLTLKNREFFVGATGPEKPGEPSIDGLFTLDFVEDADIDLDFGADTFTLFSQDHCSGPDVHGAEGAVIVVPFSRENGGRIEFASAVDGKEVHAVLNSGLGFTAMDANLARSRFNVDVKAADVKQVGQMGERPIYMRRFNSLVIGKMSISDPAIVLMPDMLGPGEHVTGHRAVIDKKLTLPELMIGLGLFKRLHLYVALKENKLYITKASAGGAP